MRFLPLIIISKLILITSGCQQQAGKTQRSMTTTYAGSSQASSDQGPTPPTPSSTPPAGSPWIGLVPIKAYFSTEAAIHNITMIDTDLSMQSELSWGLNQLRSQASRVGSKQTQTGFEVISEDHAFVVVDNSLNLFKDGQRFTVIDKALDNLTLPQQIIDFFNQKIAENPSYATETIPSLTLLTDGDISAGDQQILNSYIQEKFPEGRFYLHLIASPSAGGSLPNWCQPEAQPAQLVSLQGEIPTAGLRLSICDADWYGHFRSIGKRLIYDRAIARIVLPKESLVPGKKPYLRFDGLALPDELVQYDEAMGQIQMKLVDMPSTYQSIDIGFVP